MFHSWDRHISRAAQWLNWIVFLALALVAGDRIWTVWQSPGEASAQQEKRWMTWAWKDGDAARILEEVKVLLPPGEEVAFGLHPRRVNEAHFWRVQARYYWRNNLLGDVKSFKDGESEGKRGTQFCLGVDGSWSLRRDGKGCP